MKFDTKIYHSLVIQEYSLAEIFWNSWYQFTKIDVFLLIFRRKALEPGKIAWPLKIPFGGIYLIEYRKKEGILVAKYGYSVESP